MTRAPDRRTILIAAGAAAVAATAWPVTAQSADIRGAITFMGGAVIPEGHLEISLDDPAVTGKIRPAAARITSDGKSKSIPFSLPSSVGSTPSPTLQIVARLERADGWLLARGSAQVDAGSPVSVTLKTVMY
jgi:hypothetical protein